MANVKISELTTLASISNSTLFPVVDSSTTKKVTGSTLKQYVTTELVIRAQSADGASWTFTTVSGAGSAEYQGNWNGNRSLLFTLTGFTKMPSVAYVYDNRPAADGGQADVVYETPANMNMLTSAGGGTGFVSPGSPNIITTFTPATHKFAYGGIVQPHLYDLYFYFKQ